MASLSSKMDEAVSVMTSRRNRILRRLRSAVYIVHTGDCGRSTHSSPPRGTGRISLMPQLLPY